jgi:hypothetical protein
MNYEVSEALGYISTDKVERIARGHERRFGKSMLLLKISRSCESFADTRLKVFDPETGSSSLWDCSGWRVRCVRKHAP